MIWIYNILVTFLSPFWVPWMLIRAGRRKGKVDWAQRLGDYRLPRPSPDRPRLWFHAVSVGEVVAALPVLRAVRARAPEAEIVLSVTTSSGHEAAREKAAELFDHLVYFPIDVPRFTIGAMIRVRPRAVAIMETELWLNFLWACRLVKAQTLLVNGRISDRSYPRARVLGFFYAELLHYVDEALMQSETDAERIRSLGASEARVLGNCKFDQAVEGIDDGGRDWRAELGMAPTDQVIVVGSTRGEREEEFVAAALSDPRLQGARVVWAPRHLERVPALAARLGPDAGLRSEGARKRVTILDTYGELAQVYAVADVVVIGGGFDRLGGQNLIQPLAHGKPVVHGPHMQNFRDATEMAARAGCTVVAHTPAELAEALASLLHDPQRRRTMGDAAQALVRQNVGASDRYAEAIVTALRRPSEPTPARVPSAPRR